MVQNTVTSPADTASTSAEAGHIGAENTGSAGGPATEVDRLRFDLLRSALYHDMRQTLLLRVHRILTFLNLLAGSAAIAAFGATFPIVGIGAGLMVAVISAAQLTWDFGGTSGRHTDLRRRFYALLAELERGGAVGDCRAAAARSANPRWQCRLRRPRPALQRRRNAVARLPAGPCRHRLRGLPDAPLHPPVGGAPTPQVRAAQVDRTIFSTVRAVPAWSSG